ncbi:MAG: prepilin-type N-terminal cleavage/methylation domain-containing protein [Candidatus Krumholzibacteriia bacterium]|jgi:prepilin-type N-terminal cleavage/methylation domain-containing protein
MIAKLPNIRQFLPLLRVNRRGVSMVEIIVVISVVGIIASISAPPIFQYVQSNRLQTTSDRMAADLQYARSLSIASSEILRFTSTAAGYELSNPISGNVIREKEFTHGMSLPVNQTADFFPWGMADATIFSLSNGSDTRQVTLLPTGIVEVY